MANGYGFNTSSMNPLNGPIFIEQPELSFDPVQMTDYGAYENQFDFISQAPSSNGVSSTTCKDYRLTEFGNYDDDGTFFLNT